MHNDAQTRALEVCVQSLQAGEKLEHILELYPQYTAELTQPLEAAQALRVYTGSLQMPRQNLEGSRAGFLETARQFVDQSNLAVSARSRTVRLGRLVLFLALLVLFAWISISAFRALPGELFYPLKQAAWQVRVQASTDPNQKLELTRRLDQIHLGEVRSLSLLGREAVVSFSGLLQVDPSGTWKASGIPLKLADQTEVIGKVISGIWVEVSGKLQTDGTVSVERIRPHEIVLKGVLQDLTSDTLQISGIPVQFGQDTLVHGSPLIGSQVEVIAFRTLDDHLLARLVDANISP